MASAEPHLSLSSHVETSKGDVCTTDPGKGSTALCSSSRDRDSKSWVVDFGASDHMTFEAIDFVQTSQPQQTCIANANGVLSPVTRASIVNLSPTLLSICFRIFLPRRSLGVVLSGGGTLLC
jgi:hypothetical protein